MLSRLFAVTSVLILTMGCDDGQGVTVPDLPRTVLEGPGRMQFVFPGEAIPNLPFVNARYAGDGAPVAGTLVTFRYTDETISTAVTDKNGFAVIQSWLLDYRRAQDSVVATAAGFPGSITFKVTILHKPTIATYDLRSVAGKEPPLTYPGGEVSFDITGAHYVLFADGTYVFSYEFKGKNFWSQPQPFVRRGSALDFYLDPATFDVYSEFYAKNNYLLSTGTLSGNIMTVKYTDTFDYQEETYQAR